MKAKEIINWVVYFICLLAVVFVINTFVVQRTMVSGDSMYPYLHNKDQLMMDKLSYRFHDPERFDIVVFPVVRDGKEEYYIKRVIGLPGETVQIIDGYVYINGEKLDENYGAEVMNDAGRAAEPITLGDDEYFVLGIIAKGRIIVNKEQCEIDNGTQEVFKALLLEKVSDADDALHLYDVFMDGANYLGNVSAFSNKKEADTKIDYATLITYQNWTKE